MTPMRFSTALLHRCDDTMRGLNCGLIVQRSAAGFGIGLAWRRLIARWLAARRRTRLWRCRLALQSRFALQVWCLLQLRSALQVGCVAQAGLALNARPVLLT